MKPVLVLSLVLCSVAVAQQPTKARKMGLARPLEFTTEHEVYGAKLTGSPHLPMATLMKDAKKWHGKKVQVRGEITGVCLKKGCWMTIKEGPHHTRVRFRDYGFFVPLDVDGRKTAVEATVVVRVESQAERRHYAEDAGWSREKIETIKGDKVLVSLLADAVQIGKLPPLPTAKASSAKKGDTGQKKLTDPVCPEVPVPAKKGTKSTGKGAAKGAAKGVERKG